MELLIFSTPCISEPKIVLFLNIVQCKEQFYATAPVNYNLLPCFVLPNFVTRKIKNNFK